MTVAEYLEARTIVRLAERRLEQLTEANGRPDQIAAVHQIIAEAKQFLSELLENATPAERRKVTIALSEMDKSQLE